MVDGDRLPCEIRTKDKAITQAVGLQLIAVFSASSPHMTLSLARRLFLSTDQFQMFAYHIVTDGDV